MARGRQIYNFRCYFCHGYNGDAQTLASKFLTPAPRDFTRSPGLTRAQIAAALRDGRPGTAMASFRDVLGSEEIEQVAAFVADLFVERRGLNTDYHTAENGWPNHQARYGAAFPFVRGDLAIDTPPDRLTATQRAGLALFKSGCVTCHEPAAAPATAPPPVRWPIPIEAPERVAPTADDHDDDEGYSRDATAIHDVLPQLTGLTAAEAAGQRHYQRACAYCHAADGTGENWIGEFLRPHPTNFTDAATKARLTDAALAAAIRDGIPQTSMPAFRDALAAEDIAAIIAYLRRAFLGPPPAP